MRLFPWIMKFLSEPKITQLESPTNLLLLRNHVVTTTSKDVHTTATYEMSHFPFMGVQTLVLFHSKFNGL